MRLNVTVSKREWTVSDARGDRDSPGYDCWGYVEEDAEFESVQVREAPKDSKWCDFEVDWEPKEGRVYVLIEDYTDGGTFGHSRYFEARGVYRTYEAAEEAERAERAAKGVTGYFTCHNGWRIERAFID